MREISRVQKHSVSIGSYFVSIVLAMLFVVVCATGAMGETALQVLHEFPSGEGPIFHYGISLTKLIETDDGSFLGYVCLEGAYSNANPDGDGTIFKATKDGTVTTIFSFNATNGSGPFGGLTRGPDGNFYGTTIRGGTNFDHLFWSVGNNGTIFKLSTNGTFTSLLSFQGTNGSEPCGRLEFGADGYLYGATMWGGAFGAGTLFKVSTNGAMIWSFSFDGTNGDMVQVSSGWKLTYVADGCLYGTAPFGSTNGTAPDDENGVLFKITTNGVYTPLVYFNGTNGGQPHSCLVQTSNGDLWGTTYIGGAQNLGTVFRFSTNGTLTTVASFGGTASIQPFSGLVQGQDGAFYGTTPYSSSSMTNGTIYRITTNGELTTLVVLNRTNGTEPETDFTLASDGNLYGTMDNLNDHDAPNAGTFCRLVTRPILTTTRTATNVWLSWNSFSNAAYRVEYISHIDQTNWMTLQSNIVAQGNSTGCADISGDPERYYRVVLLP